MMIWRFFGVIMLVACAFVCTVQAEQLADDSEDMVIGDYAYYSEAEIAILNKVTSKPEYRRISVGKVEYFGTLSLMLNKCITHTSPYIDREAVFITVKKNLKREVEEILFHGWIFVNNLSVNSFEDSVFEIIPIRCIRP